MERLAFGNMAISYTEPLLEAKHLYYCSNFLANWDRKVNGCPSDPDLLSRTRHSKSTVAGLASSQEMVSFTMTLYVHN